MFSARTTVASRGWSRLACDLVLVCAYRLLIDLAALLVVLPVWGDYVELAATRGASSDVWHVALSYAVTIVAYLAFRAVDRNARATRFVLSFQLLLIVIPFCTLYAHLSYPEWNLFVVVLGFVSVAGFAAIMPTPRIPHPGPWMRVVLGGLAAAMVLYLYGGLIAGGGLTRLNFDWNRVYHVRAELQEATFPFMGYALQWTGYVLNMALLVYFAHRARRDAMARVGTLAVILMQVLLFAMTNFKAFLLIPFVVVGIVLLLRRYDAFRAGMAGAAIGIGVLSVIHAFGSLWGSGVMDRIYFVPASLHSLYIQYFSNHPWVLLGATVGDFFGSTYQENMVQVIAWEYWGYEFSPNVGWIGDAYGNFGAAGVVAFAFVLAGLLRVGDKLAQRLPPGVAEGLLSGYAIVLVNSALLTSILTGGYAVALITMWFMGRLHWDNVERGAHRASGAARTEAA